MIRGGRPVATTAAPAGWATASPSGYQWAAGGLVATYALCAVPAAGSWLDSILPATRFGVNQLQRFGWAGVGALALSVWIAHAGVTARLAGSLLARVSTVPATRLGRITLAAGAAAICWSLRSRSPNADGVAFQAVFAREVPGHGVFATHDEILEFVVHSALWRVAEARWGWDVATTYQVVSSVAGGVFVWLLAVYARLVLPARSALFLAVMLAGGYVQLFFGDVENYTLTAVVGLAYFVTAERFLQRRSSVLWPSAWLAVAMMCHLVAGFLLPSLMYLWWIARRREARRGLAAGIGAFVGVIVGTLSAAHTFWGLPIARLVDSHAAGHGGNYATVLATPSLAHYWTQINLLVLLAPAVVFLVPAALQGALTVAERPIHLTIASAGMLLLLMIWHPALGPAGDWNLFANVAIPVSLLAWSTAWAGPDLASRRTALTAAALAAALHSAAWVWGHHVGR